MTATRWLWHFSTTAPTLSAKSSLTVIELFKMHELATILIRVLKAQSAAFTGSATIAPPKLSLGSKSGSADIKVVNSKECHFSTLFSFETLSRSFWKSMKSIDACDSAAWKASDKIASCIGTWSTTSVSQACHSNLLYHMSPKTWIRTQSTSSMSKITKP